MEIKTGMFLHKKDNVRFSKKNRYPVVKVYETHPAGDEYPGMVIINAAMRLNPDWVEEITETEFDEHIKRVDTERPRSVQPTNINKGVDKNAGTIESALKEAKVTPKPKAVHNPFPYHPGDYIRKKNWTFFHGSDLPAMKVNSIRKSPESGSFYINKYQLYEAHLVKLTAEEAEAINREFNDLTLAKVLLNHSQETTCIRESTGNNKKVWTEKEALRYVFTYNKTNPSKNMNAYICPHCSTLDKQSIHVGKVPTKKAISKDRFKTVEEKLNIWITIKNFFKRLFKTS